MRFFDIEFDYPGTELIDWFRDYSGSARAPRKFYGDINYRDPQQVGDIKHTWELNRHQFLARWGLDYRQTQDEGRAAGVVSLILNWIAANPRYVGVNWTSSLELALRILSWGIALDLCDGSASAKLARPVIVQSVIEQADTIRHTLSLYSSANNHLVGELVGLLAAGTFFPESEQLRGHALFARDALLREAVLQNFEDGVNREQALYYHHYTCEYLLTALALFRRMQWPVPGEYLQLLQRMLEFTHAMVDSRGEGFEIGDTDDGTVTGLNLGTGVGVYESLLWSGWRVFAEQTFGDHAAAITRSRGVEPALDDKTRYWHGDAQSPLPSSSLETPPPGCWVFPNGGYAVLRSSEVHAVFKAGPFAYPSIGAHPHCDELSVQLKLHGRDVLTDSGTYCYHGEEAWRRYFRGTTAHNTVRVDGMDQAEYAGPFLWLTHADGRLLTEGSVSTAGLKAAGEHHGYRRLPSPVRHVRLVEIGRDLSVSVRPCCSRCADQQGEPLLRVDLELRTRHPADTGGGHRAAIRARRTDMGTRRVVTGRAGTSRFPWGW